MRKRHYNHPVSEGMDYVRQAAKRTKKQSHVVHRRGRNAVSLPISKPASCTAARLPSEFLRGRYASSQNCKSEASPYLANSRMATNERRRRVTQFPMTPKAEPAAAAQILTTHAPGHRRHRSHREAGHGEARENPLAASSLTAACILPVRIPFRSHYTRSDGGVLYPKSRIGEARRAAARR